MIILIKFIECYFWSHCLPVLPNNEKLISGLSVRADTKPLNGRVKELIAIKDTDSLANYSLVNQTVCTDPDDEEDYSTIGKNWIKIDRSNRRANNETLNQQLADLNCPCIDELEHRIIEIDSEPFNDANRETLLSKLERSTSPVQMLVLN